MKLRHIEYKVCYALWIPALMLVAIGLLFVYSASAGYARNYMPRQAVWVAAGIALAIPAALVNGRVYRHSAAPVFLASILSLVLVLVTGQVRHGARSWLGWGGLGIQPSEFAKLALILVCGRYLSDFEEHRYDFRYYAVSFALLFVPLLLILAQPDLGTALVFFPVVLAMFYVSGTRQSMLAATLLAGAACFPLMWQFLKPHQKMRIVLTWHPELKPDTYGYQAIQSKIAIGSGLVFGRGYLHSLQSKLRFLPERHTDFIFSVVGEEWGFAGCVLVLLLYLALIFAGLYIARRAKTVFGEVVAVGITVLFATHVLLNLGMVMGLTPIIGLPLPLLSYGGSAMVTSLLALGILQSIYAYEL